MKNLLKSKRIFIIFLFILTFICCEVDKLGPGPEIEWISGDTTTTFQYSSGVLSGYSFYRSFNVVNNSGEISIEVQVMGENDTKVSGTFDVESDRQYSIKVTGSIKGRRLSSPGLNCLSVSFNSPNSLTNQEIQVESYFVQSFNELINDSYYCPVSLSFGEIILME